MRVLRRPMAPQRLPLRHTLCKPRGPVWLFDLDNTLHDSSKALFHAIDHAMTGAVATSLNIDVNAASQLRTLYWQRYGATVIGMVRHHGIDAKTFLDLSHQFDVAPLVHAERGLAYKLRRLKGRKILLTNAPLKYAREVLKTLKILHCFESVWTIDHMHLQGRIRPKPSLALMKQVSARTGISARQTVLVEDTLKNLKSARQAGMKTIHVFHPGTPFSNLCSRRGNYVDVRVNSIGKLLVGLRELHH
jgi:putative hydrolase of the HAD superfamily